MRTGAHPAARVGHGGFAAGTLIRVRASGEEPEERAIEKLVPGDLVCVQASEVRPLRRVTKRPIGPADPGFGPAMMVRLRTGALGPDSPRRDLRLAADQQLCFPDGDDWVRVPAAALVNGTSILRDRVHAGVALHVPELDAPDLAWAEGVAVALHEDDDAALGERRRMAARLLLPGREMLALRARLLGETLPPEVPDWEPEAETDQPIRIYADGREVPPATGPKDWEWAFDLPPGSTELILIAQEGYSAAPADLRPLGVAVMAMHVDGTALDLRGPAAGRGFHDAEGNDPWRWTSGRAEILLPAGKGVRRFAIRVNDWHKSLRR